MKLNDTEKAMLDGAKGAAIQRAMDLLVRYGEALGAERLVDTKNVCGTIGATTPFMRDGSCARISRGCPQISREGLRTFASAPAVAGWSLTGREPRSM